MRTVKACIVCLAVDVKLYSMNENQTKQQYYLLTGLQVKQTSGLPEYLCCECNRYVKHFIKFRDKCLRTHFALQELLQRSTEINTITLKAVNRNAIGINPFLTIVRLEHIHYEPSTEINQSSFINNDITACNLKGTLSTESSNSNEENIKNENWLINFQESLNTLIKEEISCEQSTSDINVDGVIVIDDSDNNENNFSNDNNDPSDSDVEVFGDKDKQNAKVIDQQIADAPEVKFATLYPITKNEAKAVLEINRTLCTGCVNRLSEYNCDICSKPFFNKARLNIHKRMHDKHTSGNFWCDLCNYYYKSEFMLKTHVRDKHMYKYVCKKCPEVNFDRSSARQHYTVAHVVRQKKEIAAAKNVITRKLKKKVKTALKKKKNERPMRSFMGIMKYTPVKQEDQYRLIQERKTSKNFIECEFKCEMCFRGFKNQDTYDTHMKKHDPNINGVLQCDMCKVYCTSKRHLYSHMKSTHLSQYTCYVCKPSFVCHSSTHAHSHYKWHKNITYDCPHCDLKFKKISSKLTHLRMFHPSAILCRQCGNSFVSKAGLYLHLKRAHTPQEIELVSKTTVDKTDPWYCADCDVQFLNQDAFATHLRSSSKHGTRNSSIDDLISRRLQVRRDTRMTQNAAKQPTGKIRKMHTQKRDIVTVRPITNCDICDVPLKNENQELKHYLAAHPGAEVPKRYMCDVCGHVTQKYYLLTAHMRTHSQEKPYQCPHCDRRFSMPSSRDRHLGVHTGAKKYECPHCDRRFTQSFGVKVHIQTVHLKIPYAPWDKKSRKKRKELRNAVKSTSASASSETPLHKPTHGQGDYLDAFLNYRD